MAAEIKNRMGPATAASDKPNVKINASTPVKQSGGGCCWAQVVSGWHSFVLLCAGSLVCRMDCRQVLCNVTSLSRSRISSTCRMASPNTRTTWVGIGYLSTPLIFVTSWAAFHLNSCGNKLAGDVGVIFVWSFVCLFLLHCSCQICRASEVNFNALFSIRSCVKYESGGCGCLSTWYAAVVVSVWQQTSIF